ncbi:MAG: ATP-binding protein [Steroidobacteraceae bacterium]
MHSLYWRIFLAFWIALALILVGTLTVAVNATAHRTEKPWVQRGQLFAQADRAFESGGADGLKNWLNSLNGEPFSRTFVIGPTGRDMLGRPLPQFLDTMSPGGATAHGAGVGARPGAISPIGGMLVLVDPAGSTWHVVVGPVREGPRLFGELELPGVPVTILVIALVVSGVVCFFLARYLAAPVDKLRLATRQMAAGDLNVRVLPALKGRQDDLGLLASDLDAMAEQLKRLLETKEQLLRDVSHELRSPLARLQIALSLARREESAAERHLARIACEADRLELLIARTLKLARLERGVYALEHARVDVGALLRNIAADVAIEADARGCLVTVQAEQELIVSGDPELLRSAFENVIRNAVSYSPANTLVAVGARRTAASGPPAPGVEITVRDHGPGVPDRDLQLIFEPFYRVEAAREHRSGGGEGLGLAIAARAVTLHGGAIKACNLHGGGLTVSITLPAAGGPVADTDLAAAAAAA